MTIAHEKMQPIQIHDENSEFLQDINGCFGSIRTINCYGPQENLEIEVRKEFFIEWESRIIYEKRKPEINLLAIWC